MEKGYLVLVICFCCLIPGSRSSGAGTTLTPIPIILDVDVDTSDTNALLYLLKNPLVSIKAITVCCGVTYIDAGVENVLKLLDYLDIENIPVAGGSPSPLVANHSFPTEWREASNNFYGVSLPTTPNQPSEKNASELIVTMLHEAETPMPILALGPLTNIAHAIQRDPTVTQKIARIDIMGGAVNVPGNIGNVYPPIPNYVAEWNFYIDPHAAEIVFSSIENIRLVPLDATNQVPITAGFKTKLEEQKQTKEAEIAYQLLVEGLFFWDELTAVAFTNSEVLILEMNHINIVIDQETHEGQTVKNASAPTNAAVAIGADPVAFEELFLSAINHETKTTTTTTTEQGTNYEGFIPLVMGLGVLFLNARKRSREG